MKLHIASQVNNLWGRFWRCPLIVHPAHKLKLVKLPSHIRKSSKPREKLGSMSFVFLTLILHSIKDVVGSNSALEKKGDPLCWGNVLLCPAKAYQRWKIPPLHLHTLLILHYFLKTLFLWGLTLNLQLTTNLYFPETNFLLLITKWSLYKGILQLKKLAATIYHKYEFAWGTLVLDSSFSTSNPPLQELLSWCVPSMNQDLNLVPHLSPRACKTKDYLKSIQEFHYSWTLDMRLWSTCSKRAELLHHSKLLHPSHPLLLLLIVNDGQRNEWSFADAKGPKRSLFTSSSFRFESEGKLAKQV